MYKSNFIKRTLIKELWCHKDLQWDEESQLDSECRTGWELELLCHKDLELLCHKDLELLCHKALRFQEEEKDEEW